jgi:transcriptional repressor NrdR
MHCPECNHPDTKVTDSRESAEGVRRRRECLLCSHRFTTIERHQSVSLQVIKRDGAREDFSADKVRAGVLRACARRPVTLEAVERLVEGVERDARRDGRTELPSTLIGQMVMERLRAVDRVAYLRFASVYRNFQDVESFVQEAQQILEEEREATLARLGRRPVREPNGDLPEAQLPLPLNGNAGQPARRGRRTRAGPPPQGP